VGTIGSQNLPNGEYHIPPRVLHHALMLDAKADDLERLKECSSPILDCSISSHNLAGLDGYRVLTQDQPAAKCSIADLLA
jgi:hypothetical protein